MLQAVLQGGRFPLFYLPACGRHVGQLIKSDTPKFSATSYTGADDGNSDLRDLHLGFASACYMNLLI